MDIDLEVQDDDDNEDEGEEQIETYLRKWELTARLIDHRGRSEGR